MVSALGHTWVHDLDYLPVLFISQRLIYKGIAAHPQTRSAKPSSGTQERTLTARSGGMSQKADWTQEASMSGPRGVSNNSCPLCGSFSPTLMPIMPTPGRVNSTCRVGLCGCPRLKLLSSLFLYSNTHCQISLGLTFLSAPRNSFVCFCLLAR